MPTENLSPQKEEMIIDFDLDSDETFISLENNYRLVDHPDDPKAEYRCFEILHGDFAGLIYRYGRFKIAGRDNPDNSRTIEYEYDVIQIPDHVKGVSYPPEKEREFSSLLANVLIDIVTKWTEKNKEETIFVKEEDVEARANNTDKLVTRRSVYPTGNPFPQE